MIHQNPYDEYKNDVKLKANKWLEACSKHEYAIDNNNKQQPLEQLDIKHLAFCGGYWRIQVDFPCTITHVRDQNMVLVKKLDREENTLFEYWTAKLVGYNCYGPFISEDIDYIVAKYETDLGVYWGYGKTIEKARAFLGLKLYDEHKNLINDVVCKNKQKNSGK
ncbi:MAG: hypothetical protein MJ156_01950 [Alphaproteobacteria bacterium]|nr:hypothetical protein [Alphaproteobacteria bacterium]